MSLIEHKQGDTIAWHANAYEDDGVTAQNLTGYAIACDMRDADGNLVNRFTITITDVVTGAFKFSRFATNTVPLGRYYFDLKYTYNGDDDRTDTVEVQIVKKYTE